MQATTPPQARTNGKSKALDQARAKRQTQTTQAVAAAVTPKPAAVPRAQKTKATKVKTKVKNFVLPVDVISLGNARISEFFDETERGLSWSGLAEAALRELLGRDDFAAVIDLHRVVARRPNAEKPRPA